MEEYEKVGRFLINEAATIIRRYFAMGVEVEIKEDGSPVTQADLQAEYAMRQMIKRVYPEHGIIGEEYGLHNPDAPFQWTLDPIDGTKNFTTGSFLFGTLVSLLKDGKPILGMLNHPLTEQLMIGYNGATTLNDSPVHVRACASIDEALMLSTTHWGVAKHHNMDAYTALTRRARDYKTWGDCHGYFLLANGQADIMCDPVMKIWDVAPLVPIVEGAGGRITDWYGNDPITGRGVVATAGTIHDDVLDMLNP